MNAEESVLVCDIFSRPMSASCLGVQPGTVEAQIMSVGRMHYRTESFLEDGTGDRAVGMGVFPHLFPLLDLFQGVSV